jgi:ADP-ribose pyrophosphatase YjhB (NUDIX family)
MHKVFFKDRTVFFETDANDSFRNNGGLFYRYNNTDELKEVLNAFLTLNSIKQLFLYHTDIALLKREFVSCFKLIKASGGVVRNRDGKFLMIFRNGVWDLPKGKNDRGESSEIAALREISEEVGLNQLSILSEITKTYHVYQLKKQLILKETTWYEIMSDDKNLPVPQTSENITLAVWMNSSDLSTVSKNTFPSIIEVFRGIKLLP